MHRRRVLSLLCLAGASGCLRLQGGSQSGTATSEADEPTTVDSGSNGDSEAGTGPTLTERWTDELSLERVWPVNTNFFIQSNTNVARAFPSGLDWTYNTPYENGNHATEAFAHNNGRVVFGISPDEGESEDPNSAAYYLAFNAATGERKWRYEMPKDGTHEYARGAAIVDDIAVMASFLWGSSDNHDPLIVGVDVETGEQVWETHLTDHVSGAKYLTDMAVYDGAVCVGMGYDGVAVLNPRTGSVDQHFGSIRTTDGGTVSGGSFFGDDGQDAAAYSLDDGSGQWSNSIDDRTHTPPAVDNTVVVFGTGSGTVYVFERASGELRWEQQVNATVNALTLTAAHVWVADQSNGLTAFSRDDGAVQLRATYQIEDMVARGDSLLIGDDTTTLFTIN